jgi:hypothetical protein
MWRHCLSQGGSLTVRRPHSPPGSVSRLVCRGDRELRLGPSLPGGRCSPRNQRNSYSHVGRQMSRPAGHISVGSEPRRERMKGQETRRMTARQEFWSNCKILLFTQGYLCAEGVRGMTRCRLVGWFCYRTSDRVHVRASGKVNSRKRSRDGAILCWRWRSWDKQCSRARSRQNGSQREPCLRHLVLVLSKKLIY